MLQYTEAQLGEDRLQDTRDSKSEDSSETGKKRGKWKNPRIGRRVGAAYGTQRKWIS